MQVDFQSASHGKCQEQDADQKSAGAMKSAPNFVFHPDSACLRASEFRSGSPKARATTSGLMQRNSRDKATGIRMFVRAL